MNRQIAKETAFDEVYDSQKVFRVLMDAISQPGKLYQLAQHRFTGFPAGFNPYILSVMKTVCDNSVSIAIGSRKGEAWQEYLELNTGACRREINKADYVVFAGEEFSPDFFLLNRGTLEFPETSATCFLSVDSIRPGSAEKQSGFRLRGPGIKDVNLVEIEGLDSNYLRHLGEINEIFPLGVDAVIIDKSGSIICLPRTTKVEVE